MSRDMSREAVIIIVGAVLESGNALSRTRLMKLLFLLRMEKDFSSIPGFYDFLPYKFGPYSFAADRDLYRLNCAGLLTGERISIPDDRMALARDAYATLPPALRTRLLDLVTHYRRLPDPDLINLIYSRYPEFTLLSELLDPPPARPVASPAVYTIGYEGTSVDSFLHALIRHGIVRLIDVRNNPVSRKYGFSRPRLSGLLERIGVEYIHRGELGIPSRQRKNLQRPEQFLALFDGYETGILANNKESVEEVSAFISEKASALLCFELDPQMCHRGRLADEVAHRTGLPVHHLTASNG